MVAITTSLRHQVWDSIKGLALHTWFQLYLLNSEIDTLITKTKPTESKKRKQWTEDSMVAALQVVKDGQGVTNAAKTYGVPRSIEIQVGQKALSF